jgi:hypothetical protein
MFSVRFFRLCSRAPPMRINSLLMAANFSFESTGKYIQTRGESKAGVGRISMGAHPRTAPQSASRAGS